MSYPLPRFIGTRHSHILTTSLDLFPVIGCGQAAAQVVSQVILLLLAQVQGVLRSQKLFSEKRWKNRTGSTLDVLVDLLIYFNTD